MALRTYAHDGLTFDVADHGPSGGRPVILLHGFPEDRHCWNGLTASLVDAKFRVLAPDQRGYSAGARPLGRRQYTVDRLAGDVLALADAAGAERFDLVGHDWGATVAWRLAGTHPERVCTLSALSVPHSRALVAAAGRGGQLRRSWYMGFFQLPWLPEELFRLGGSDRFAARLVRSGLDGESARRYAARATTPSTITGPLNWYRGIPWPGQPAQPIRVPTLYVWGDRDRFVTRAAAEGCAQHVVGPYRFVPLAGAGHWLPSTSAAPVGTALLTHLTGTPG
jgi:pimeloyl-ACP methyl ester carboxylesterase